MKEIKRRTVKSKQEVMMMAKNIEGRVELIQALIPLGLAAVGDLLQQEVQELVGERYERERAHPGLVRWGQQKSSVYLSDQKLSVNVPRVRDYLTKKEMALKSLEQLKVPRNCDEGLFRKVLKGLSCRDYEGCAEAVPEAFGLSASTISRRYIRASARKLKELISRDLGSHDFVAIVMDGKHFAKDEIVICVGITVEGEKMILGFIQTATENEKSCSDFLRELLERGLKVEEGLLCLIDGSKGLHKAIESVLGERAVIQRCQWHKRENVVSYLPEEDQGMVRRKLQAAYEKPTYKEARASLLKVKAELEIMNLSAMRSLEEGFEETLSLHRLGLFKELGVSLKTTNLIESINARLGEKTDKVDYWKSSDQKQRWVASALLEIEKGFRKIKGFRNLPRLKEALKKTITERNIKNMKLAA